MATNTTSIPTSLIPTIQEQQTRFYPNNIPHALLESPHFLLWSPTLSPSNGKILKVPLNKNSWQTKLTSSQAASELLTKANQTRQTKRQALPEDDVDAQIALPPLGMGFAYTKDHPFVCIDIDSTSKDNLAFIRDLDSYTEWSPSSTGYHTIIELDSIDDKQALINLYSSGKRDKTNERDLFISSSYVTLTGDIAHALNDTADSTPSTINITKIRKLSFTALSLILDKYFNAPTKITARQEAQEGHKTTQTLRTKQSQAEYNAQHFTPQTPAQTRQLLKEVPVVNLTSDIFNRLTDPNQSAILDPDNTEEAREPWLIIGQAIHHNFAGQAIGLSIWQDWSAQGTKYDQAALKSAWDSFDITNDATQITIGSLIKLVNAQKPQFPHLTSKGAIQATQQNIIALLAHYNLKVQTHELTKQPVFHLTKKTKAKWHINSDKQLARLSPSIIAENIKSDFISLGCTGFSPKAIASQLQQQAAESFYNPIREYFTNLPAPDPKRDYIQELLDTMTFQAPYQDSPKHQQAFYVFLKKWLIQVVAGATHTSPSGIHLSRTIIFQGDQGIGKTRWVKSLFPSQLQEYCAGDKDLKLSKFKSDSTKLAMELSSTLICNVNEIDKVFASDSYAAEFKSFLDQTADNIVLPYGSQPTRMMRRTVFIGSTNKRQFLCDLTGNRRFELFPLLTIDANHSVDIDLLWSQVYALYEEGQSWWMDKQDTDPVTRNAIRVRDELNRNAMQVSNEEFSLNLDNYFDAEAPREHWQKMDFATIRKLIGEENLPKAGSNSRVFKSMKNTLLTWLKQITPIGIQITSQTGAVRPRLYYIMPPLRATPLSVQDTLAIVTSQEPETIIEEAPKAPKELSREELIAQIQKLQALL